MKKRIAILFISVIACIGLGIYGYSSIEGYLQNRFGPNTWIGDIYCTGKTVDEVNQELLAQMKAPIVMVTDVKGRSYEYDLSQAEYTYDYSEVLASYQKNQVSYGWVENVKQKNEILLGQPAFSYDANALTDWWGQLPIVKEEETAPTLELCLAEDGYQLVSTLEGHLDIDKGLAEVVNAVDQRQEAVVLQQENCYFDYEMDATQRNTYQKWEALKKMERCGLVYDMGAEQIVFDGPLMSSFIAKNSDMEPLYDENGQFYYDKERVDAYMEELCESYHTWGVKHDFMSSRGEIVQVEGVTYGTELNKEAEMQFVWDCLSNEETRLASQVHTPEYLHETAVHGLNDIGDTYIEVDMGEQKIYFYKDGELLVSSDVVTGNLRTRHDTPEGVNFIYGKAKNRVLRGPGYASFVRYWMPVIKAIGLHDANWRDEFGGEIYKTSGSHGCVNLPDETADIIWEYAEIGTPVIMFY